MKKTELLQALNEISKLVEGSGSPSPPIEGGPGKGNKGGGLPSDDKEFEELVNEIRQKSHEAGDVELPDQHVYRDSIICETDKRGRPEADHRDLLEIVVDTHLGFVPLWAKGVTLNWRINEASLNPYSWVKDTLRTTLRGLLARGVNTWGFAAPVRFAENNFSYDFEIVMMPSDNCNSSGACVLASAFFPDGGRHQLKVYPKLFSLSTQEMVETMAHELGHVFGLRHFFADVSEKSWPSEVFGTHSKFSIMNYGANSFMTSADISDLNILYQSVWNGSLTEINGTDIRLFQPFTASGQKP